jgi:hypothetical protein
VDINRDWPTAAQACFSARSLGRLSKPSAPIPAPTAPLVTTTTSFPDLPQRRHLSHDLFELRGINLLPAVREDAGAEFDNDAGDIFEQFRTHAC